MDEKFISNTDFQFQNDLFIAPVPYVLNDSPFIVVEITLENADVYEELGYSPVEHTYVEELDNFSLETCENLDMVVGYPEAALGNWEYQEGNTCALHAQRMIIEEITGESIDINDMQAVAEAYGWFDDGTPEDCLNKMLDYCGIPNEDMNCTGYDQLREMLSNGDKVIACVDSDEYWFGEYDDIYNPDYPNHAVEVIGIDETDPENPMVILNDTGIPNGQGVRVPADCFMDAWDDSGNHCIRVPVYTTDQSSISSSLESSGGIGDYYSESGSQSQEANMIGYSADYYRHEMEKALKNGNSIAYENARKNWAKETVKESTH